MSEEKKIVELNDEHLNKVNGGSTGVDLKNAKERKGRETSLLESKVPIFKAGKSNKEAVK